MVFTCVLMDVGLQVSYLHFTGIFLPQDNLLVNHRVSLLANPQGNHRVFLQMFHQVCHQVW